jgi:hypothetical protein
MTHGMTMAAHGTLAGGAWWPINRLGQFRRTGAHVEVWAQIVMGVGVETRWPVRGVCTETT